MLRIVLVWFINSATMLLLPQLLPGWITVENFLAAVLAALAVGFVNTFIKPVFTILTLPLTVFSMGIFMLVLNGLMFWLAAGFVPGFSVSGFGAAIGGAMLYSILTWAFSTLLIKNR